MDAEVPFIGCAVRKRDKRVILRDVFKLGLFSIYIVFGCVCFTFDILS